MGFGYLCIGYLIVNVLYLTVQAFGVGALALLLGYGAMMLGLWELTHYNAAFVYAKWCCVPLLCLSLYRMTSEFATLFLWDSPIFGDAVGTVTGWCYFALVVAFHFALLYGIRVIAREVELDRAANASMRNAVFVALYAVVYLLTNLVFAGNELIRGYFVFSLVLTQVVYVLFDLTLLISCTKNICPEGEEDVPQREHKLAILNKLDALYDRTRQRSADQARADGEAFARRRRAKKEQRKNRKKH